MKRLFLLVPLMVFIVLGTQATKAEQPTKIYHTLYTNAYYFYENEDNWYMLTLEYQREDNDRVYFGGFVDEAPHETRIGKWISGSVPKESLKVSNKVIPLNSITY